MPKFISLQTNASPPLKARLADTFFSRFLGLMGKKELPPGEGLLLSPCSSIHMLFMRFPIDAVYLDSDCRILKIVPRLPPWRGLSFCPGARACLEIGAGEAAKLGWQAGDILH